MAFRNIKKTEELLELYEEEDLLWDTAHEYYYRKDKRRQALGRISAMLGVPASEVNRKLTNLRTYYCKELNKIKWSRMKMAKGGELYVSKWEHFATMDRFLYPYIQGRKHMELSDENDSGDPEDLDEDGSSNWVQLLKQEDRIEGQEEDQDTSGSSRKRRHQDEPSLELSPRTHISIRERLRRKYPNNTHTQNQNNAGNVSGTGTASRARVFPKAEDREDVFGKHVANELRLIPDFQTRQLVKLKIQNILFEAQFSCELGLQPNPSSLHSDANMNFHGPATVEEGQSGLDSSDNTVVPDQDHVP